MSLRLVVRNQAFPPPGHSSPGQWPGPSQKAWVCTLATATSWRTGLLSDVTPRCPPGLVRTVMHVHTPPAPEPIKQPPEGVRLWLAPETPLRRVLFCGMCRLKRYPSHKPINISGILEQGLRVWRKWLGLGTRETEFQLKVCLHGLEEAILPLWTLVFICKMSIIKPISWCHCEDGR